jgi:quercetin dioxygenase-like cupin family protein
MLKKVSLLVLLAAALALAAAQSAQKMAAPPAADHHSINEGDIKWGPAPPVFAPGAQMAVMDGNPGAAGTFVIRLKMPAGYKIMPHWHPTQENVTVISGTFQYGMGDNLTPAAMTTLSPGGFVALGAKAHHYAMAKTASVVQVTAMGPFKLTYVHPADDPQNVKHEK